MNIFESKTQMTKLGLGGLCFSSPCCLLRHVQGPYSGLVVVVVM